MLSRLMRAPRARRCRCAEPSTGSPSPEFPGLASAPGAILALDIDGVLHPAAAPDDELLTQLPLLESWLRRHPGVEIVVTSSWRVSHSLKQLRALFSEDLRSRVVGMTGMHWQRVYAETGDVPLTTRHERDLELQHWLAQHGAAERPWVALDDQVGNYAPGRHNIVLCDPRIGLTDRELAELDRLLEGRL